MKGVKEEGPDAPRIGAESRRAGIISLSSGATLTNEKNGLQPGDRTCRVLAGDLGVWRVRVRVRRPGRQAEDEEPKTLSMETLEME